MRGPLRLDGEKFRYKTANTSWIKRANVVFGVRSVELVKITRRLYIRVRVSEYEGRETNPFLTLHSQLATLPFLCTLGRFQSA